MFNSYLFQFFWFLSLLRSKMTIHFSVDSVTLNRRPGSVFVAFASVQCTEVVFRSGFSRQDPLISRDMACFTQILVENGRRAELADHPYLPAF